VGADDDDDDAAPDLGDFPLRFSQADPEPSIASAAGAALKDELKERDTKAADALAPDELKRLVGDMCRYLLMKGSKGEPILRSKLNDDVLGEYRKKKVTTYVLAEAQSQLRSVWGYDLVASPCGRAEFASTTAFKGCFYLMLRARRPPPPPAARGTAPPPCSASSALAGDAPESKGLLMVVLALIWCSPGRELDEAEM
jgi:hypothetical protein